MFDIDFVTKNFSSCAPGRYLEKFKDASNGELLKFKKEIIHHRKNNKQQQAFSNVKYYSTHKALISAINYELLKRSNKYYIYKKLFPLRKHTLKMFRGIELIENELYGTHYTTPEKHSNNFIHTEITIKLVAKLISQIFLYIFKNLYWIAPTTIAAIIAIWLNK